MARHGLMLKASKSYWMHNKFGKVKQSDALVVKIHVCRTRESGQMEQQIKFAKSTRLVVLGVALSPEADAATTVNHRIALATKHWHARRQQLTRRRSPLIPRFRRYKQTVAKTLVWGLQSVRWTQTAFRSVVSFDRRCMRGMMARRRRKRERWKSFYRRVHSRLRSVLAEGNLHETGFDILMASHGWFGHM
eukprot:3828653-Karenia_brevis.AAC.1